METYKTSGVCAREISFTITDGVVRNVSFDGGCNGNSKGIGSLVEGMEIHDAIQRLKGTDCDGKGTSCPDQLAEALAEYLRTK